MRTGPYGVSLTWNSRLSFSRRTRCMRTPNAVVSVSRMRASSGDFSSVQSHRKNESRPVLLHLSGGKKRVERTRGKEAFHGDPCQFRAQVVEIRLNLHDLVDLSVGGVPALAKERAEYIRTRATIASSESVADLLNLHFRKRTERRGKLGEQRGSGRCDKLVGLFDLSQRDSR